jgi:hypothetical protein
MFRCDDVARDAVTPPVAIAGARRRLLRRDA